MNLSKVAPLVIAVLCIAALGVSATTLETTLSTDPDEEIDPSYDELPIGQDDAAVLQQEMEGSEQEEERSEQASDSQQSTSSSSNADSSESQTTQSEATGTGSTPPSLLDRLLALLMSLLRVLFVLAVVLSAVALAVRYRERILATLSALFESDEETGTDPDVDAGVDAWPDEEPSNVVDRAWVAMVREIDPERPAVMTPSECADAARAAGLDAATVEAVTDAFERVNYGGASVSDERDRAAEALRRIREAAASAERDRRPPGDVGGDR